jgi:large subunit ribosomal protein L21
MEFCNMYAIIETGDKQFRVEQGMKLQIPAIEAEQGTAVVFDQVLLCSNGEEVVIGTPSVKNARVTATCLGDVKGEKIMVFKKKRRKNYARKTGHRQGYTLVQIDEIIAPIKALVPEEPAEPESRENPAEKTAPEKTPEETTTEE